MCVVRPRPISRGVFGRPNKLAISASSDSNPVAGFASSAGQRRETTRRSRRREAQDARVRLPVRRAVHRRDRPCSARSAAVRRAAEHPGARSAASSRCAISARFLSACDISIGRGGSNRRGDRRSFGTRRLRRTNGRCRHRRCGRLFGTANRRWLDARRLRRAVIDSGAKPVIGSVRRSGIGGGMGIGSGRRSGIGGTGMVGGRRSSAPSGARDTRRRLGHRLDSWSPARSRPDPARVDAAFRGPVWRCARYWFRRRCRSGRRSSADVRRYRAG